jgi:predicted nucleic acid-binding protein
MRRRAKVYLDTSVISALFDERNPERKTLTEMFFKNVLDVDLFVSTITIAECDRTPDLALRESMRDVSPRFPSLKDSDDADELASDYVNYGAIPERCKKDAYHIAVAVSNDMDFLLSWNFNHIVKRKTREVVRMVNTLHGAKQVEILTPAELL